MNSGVVFSGIPRRGLVPHARSSLVGLFEESPVGLTQVRFFRGRRRPVQRVNKKRFNPAVRQVSEKGSKFKPLTFLAETESNNMEMQKSALRKAAAEMKKRTGGLYDIFPEMPVNAMSMNSSLWDKPYTILTKNDYEKHPDQSHPLLKLAQANSKLNLVGIKAMVIQYIKHGKYRDIINMYDAYINTEGKFKKDSFMPLPEKDFDVNVSPVGWATFVVDQMHQAAQYGSAINFFEEFIDGRNVPILRETYHLLIDCIVLEALKDKDSRHNNSEQGSFKLLDSVFERMNKGDLPTVAPNVDTFKCVLNMFENGMGVKNNVGKEKCMDLYKEMRRLKIQPDSKLVTSFMSSFWNLGAYEECVRFFSHVQAEYPSFFRNALKENEELCQAFLSMLMNAHNEMLKVQRDITPRSEDHMYITDNYPSVVRHDSYWMEYFTGFLMDSVLGMPKEKLNIVKELSLFYRTDDYMLDIRRFDEKLSRKVEQLCMWYCCATNAKHKISSTIGVFDLISEQYEKETRPVAGDVYEVFFKALGTYTSGLTGTLGGSISENLGANTEEIGANFEKIVRIFSQCGQKSAGIYSHMIMFCGQIQQFDHALLLLGDMSESGDDAFFEPTSECLKSLVSSINLTISDKNTSEQNDKNCSALLQVLKLTKENKWDLDKSFVERNSSVFKSLKNRKFLTLFNQMRE
eukprot:Nk52_evm66s217 gene=Nk52_evmTU66s217